MSQATNAPTPNAPVEISVMHVEVVNVLEVRDDPDTKQTTVVLDRVYSDLSEELRAKLRETYQPPMEGHWQANGWTLSFVCGTPELSS